MMNEPILIEIFTKNAETFNMEARIREVLRRAEIEIEKITGETIIVDTYKVFKKEVRMPELTIEDIKVIVSNTWEVDRTLLESETKKQEYVFARYSSIAILKQQMPRLSQKQMASIFNKKDHSTIFHALKTHKELLKNYKDYKQIYDRCEVAIQRHLTQRLQLN